MTHYINTMVFSIRSTAALCLILLLLNFSHARAESFIQKVNGELLQANSLHISGFLNHIGKIDLVIDNHTVIKEFADRFRASTFSVYIPKGPLESGEILSVRILKGNVQIGLITIGARVEFRDPDSGEVYDQQDWSGDNVDLIIYPLIKKILETHPGTR